MIWLPPKKLTVLIDSREKKPILFPKRIVWRNTNAKVPKSVEALQRITISTESCQMDSGDYAIKEFPGIVGIERKGSIDELAQNTCTKDSTRFLDALHRFDSEFDYKIIFLDFSISAMWKPRGTKQPPDRVLDRFLGTCEFMSNWSLLVGGTQPRSPASKRKVGDLLIRSMLNKVATSKRKE